MLRPWTNDCVLLWKLGEPPAQGSGEASPTHRRHLINFSTQKTKHNIHFWKIFIKKLKWMWQNKMKTKPLNSKYMTLVIKISQLYWSDLVYPTIYSQGGPPRRSSTCKQVICISDEQKLITWELSMAIQLPFLGNPPQTQEGDQVLGVCSGDL